MVLFDILTGPMNARRIESGADGPENFLFSRGPPFGKSSLAMICQKSFALALHSFPLNSISNWIDTRIIAEAFLVRFEFVLNFDQLLNPPGRAALVGLAAATSATMSICCKV